MDATFNGRGSRAFVPLEMLRNSNGERIVVKKVCETSEPINQLHEYSMKHGFTTEFLDIGQLISQIISNSRLLNIVNSLKIVYSFKLSGPLAACFNACCG